RKAASLLKLLALAPGHTLHREQLVEWLWPDLGPDAARNNLKYALHVARRTLAPDPPAGGSTGVVHVEQDQLVLRPPDRLWVDVGCFKAAAAAARGSQDPADYHAAIGLYAGDLLPEDRYEDWAAEPRETL